jgi:tRNA G18 (ribose-2'-O)-methylase SpoU
MVAVLPVPGLDLPELAPYRTMKRPAEQRAEGIFVAEGEKTVRRLLASRLETVSVLVTPHRLDCLADLLGDRPGGVAVYVCPAAEMERLTGFPIYQGVLAVGRVPAAVGVADILRTAARPVLLAAIDGIANAQNTGALVRTAAAFGAQGLLVAETGASPWLRRAVGCSMGAVFDLPIVECADLAADLRALALAGVSCVAAHPRAGSAPLFETDLSGDCCLVFGSEDRGPREEVLAACPARVTVPMRGGVDSLNVVTAAAVFLYEAARGRPVR